MLIIILTTMMRCGDRRELLWRWCWLDDWQACNRREKYSQMVMMLMVLMLLMLIMLMLVGWLTSLPPQWKVIADDADADDWQACSRREKYLQMVMMLMLLVLMLLMLQMMLVGWLTSLLPQRKLLANVADTDADDADNADACWMTDKPATAEKSTSKWCWCWWCWCWDDAGTGADADSDDWQACYRRENYLQMVLMLMLMMLILMTLADRLKWPAKSLCLLYLRGTHLTSEPLANKIPHSIP